MWCNGLNVCLLPEFIRWNPNPVWWCEEVGYVGLGYKGGVLLNGISALITETPQSSLALFVT